MDGWGKQSVENLKYSINEKKYIFRQINLFFESDILVLKMQKFCQNILDLFQNLNPYKKIVVIKSLNIDGIGETQVNSIKNFSIK